MAYHGWDLDSDLLRRSLQRKPWTRAVCLAHMAMKFCHQVVKCALGACPVGSAWPDAAADVAADAVAAAATAAAALLADLAVVGAAQVAFAQIERAHLVNTGPLRWLLDHMWPWGGGGSK